MNIINSQFQLLSLFFLRFSEVRFVECMPRFVRYGPPAMVRVSYQGPMYLPYPCSNFHIIIFGRKQQSDDISEMSSNNDQQQQQQQLEYNKKWKSYILISVTSLTNFVSIGETFDQSHSNYVGSNPKVNYMFGVVSTTHIASCSILLSQPNCKQT